MSCIHGIWLYMWNKKQMSDLGGTKHDSEKVQLELLSSSWINGVGKVLTFGAKKYAAHNWRKGIALSRLLGACLRHVFAFLGGQDNDPETGLSHLLHASCCLQFAFELYERIPENVDDRFKVAAEKTMTQEEYDSIHRHPYDEKCWCVNCDLKRSKKMI